MVNTILIAINKILIINDILTILGNKAVFLVFMTDTFLCIRVN